MTTINGFYQLLLIVAITAEAAIITWVMMRNAVVLDHPNDRSSHNKPIPKSGGVAIVAACFSGYTVLMIINNDPLRTHTPHVVFAFAALLVAAGSLYDDIRDPSFIIKLSVHLTAAAILVSFGFLIDNVNVPGFGVIDFAWFAYPLTILWLVGLTNAFNFMDGLDGLAGGCAVISCLFLGAISGFYGNEFTTISCATIAAGGIGFLLFNFPPARIFMGDVGSAFLGFVLAGLAIFANRFESIPIPVLVVPLLVFNLVYDTMFTFCRRLMRGDNVFHAHRDHLYQLLNKAGYSHTRVTCLHYAMCLLQGIGAVAMVQIEDRYQSLIFIPFVVLQIIYTMAVMEKARCSNI